MQHRTLVYPLAFLVLLGAAPAWAQEQDTFKLRAGYAVKTDSNLYRLSSSANALALVGRNDASERIGTTTLGVSFNKAYSLQRLELDLSLVDYSYQNFTDLSFTARNYAAAWRWSLTPRFHGSLTSDRKETVNNFSDDQGANRITRRNQRTNSNTGFDATYEIDGTWRMLGGFTNTKQTNESATDDSSFNTANVGVRYAATSASALTYSVKTSKGEYLNIASANSEFNQLDNEVRVFWVLSGNTTANLNAAYISRSHPNAPQRDYSGLNTSATVNWNVTGKTALAASWVHQLSSYQTAYSNYAQTDRLSLGPTYQVSPKVYLGLRYDLARIDYLGSPTAAPIAQRKDTTRDTTLSLNWQPYQKVALNASVQKSTRDATVTNLLPLDYTSTMGTLSAQIDF